MSPNKSQLPSYTARLILEAQEDENLQIFEGLRKKNKLLEPVVILPGMFGSKA